ncbi:MAG: protein-L-isoaspartate O-methyltransferase [Pseudomonadota bacterium]
MFDCLPEQARFNMVQQQVRPWEVLDRRVLDILSKVPRELFVPMPFQGLAYADFEVPMGDGQLMLPPRIVGRLLQSLDPQPTDNAMLVGAGSGYVAACLAHLVKHLTAWEIRPALASQARNNLQTLGITNVEVRIGNGLQIRQDSTPIDLIAATGAFEDIEGAAGLRMQMDTGGRLFAVAGREFAMTAYRFLRIGSRDFRREALFETSLPYLDGHSRSSSFVF